MRIHLSVLPLALLATACRSGADGAGHKFKGPAGDTTAVVAGFDTIGVTKGQVDRALQPMTMQIAQQAQQTGQTFEEVALPLRRQAAAQLLLQAIMEREAIRLKITPSAHQIDSVYTLVRESFPDSATFEKAMLQAGDTPASARLKFSKQLAANLALEALLKDSLVVSPAQVDSFYQANKDRMGQAGKMHARHILKLARTPADTATAHKQILAIAEKLKGGADFAAVAKAESQDPGSAEKGGDLGWFDPKDMVPEFAMALKALQPGQTSEPIRTQFGWHIIHLDAVKTGAAPALDSVKPMIEEMLKSRKAAEVVPNFYRSLVRQYKVAFVDTTYREPELFGEAAPKPQPGTAPAPAVVPAK